MVALRYCMTCYQKNKSSRSLCQGIFTYGEDDISQEKFCFPQAEDTQRRRTAFRMLSRLVAEKGKPLSSFWDSYRTAVLYRDDFEAMYSCYFGCQAGAGTPEYKAWIQRYINRTGNMNKSRCPAGTPAFCVYFTCSGQMVPPAPGSPRAKTLYATLIAPPHLAMRFRWPTGLRRQKPFSSSRPARSSRRRSQNTGCFGNPVAFTCSGQMNCPCAKVFASGENACTALATPPHLAMGFRWPTGLRRQKPF